MNNCLDALFSLFSERAQARDKPAPALDKQKNAFDGLFVA
jgi:hypothetical protein